MDAHLRDLRYFVAIADEGSITGAAERLHLSQPALSKQLRALERQLRGPLFERLPRELRLTAAGAELLPWARKLLADWDQAQRAVARTGNCTVVLGMQTAPGRGLLAEIRQRLVADCPGVVLEPRPVPWTDPSAGLADGSADVAFAWSPLPPRFRTLVIAREPRLVALSRKHRLAGRRSVTMAELLDEPFLALPESAGPARDFWLATADRGGRAPVVSGVVTDTDSTYEGVAACLGIALLAAGNAPILARGDVVMPEVSDLGPAQLVLAWDERRLSPLAAQVVRICAAIAAGVTPGGTAGPPAPGGSGTPSSPR